MHYEGLDKDIDKFFLLRGINYDKDKHQITVPCKCKWVDNHNKCRLYAWRPDSCRAYECDKLKSMVADSNA